MYQRRIQISTSTTWGLDPSVDNLYSSEEESLNPIPCLHFIVGKALKKVSKKLNPFEE